MSNTISLYGPLEPDASQAPGVLTPAPANALPRLRLAERSQVEMRCLSLNDLLPAEHQARIVWHYVEQLDITPLLTGIGAVAGRAGRDANDPRILLALWLYATIDGVGSARELDRLCNEHVAYQWLCGGVSMNYHTLADFRTEHVGFLDRLLTEGVATMLHQDLIDLQRVAQDGMRVRASAGASSFRRQPSLQSCLRVAEAQVEALRNQVDEDNQAATRRQQAARERAARERVERVQKALQERERLVELRERQKREKSIKYDPAEQRASTTDPEACKMKFADGGTRPGYNVQFTTTTAGGAIVEVDVTNSGGDGGQMAPMVDQFDARYGKPPAEVLVDGGYTTLEDIETVHAKHETKVYGPIKEEEKKRAKGIDPHQPRPKDTPGVAAWRQRMGTDEARTIYRLRAQTAEWTNAGARNRGLYQVNVRSRVKVLAVALWFALAHNLLVHHRLLTQRQEAKGST